MDWLQALDLSLFRFLNGALSNPVFDVVMPFFSGNALFFPVVCLVAIGLAWKGGARGRLCLLMLALIVPLGDSCVINPLKHLIERPRPFVTLDEVHLLVGRGRSASMPSAHAANWGAATMIFFLYYRRSILVMLPLALAVGFSRIYNGVHYPSDVLAGGIIGAGLAVAGVWLLNAVWQRVGSRWFPLWWQRLPSLVPEGRNQKSGGRRHGLGDKAHEPEARNQQPETCAPSTLNQHWLRLGYVLIAVLLVARLGYLAGGKIELSEDEAYQWIWSKHPALSYYSKPPLIAYAQMLGTAIWGDNTFGVRFFSPVIAAVLGCLVLRFFAREFSARLGFWLVAMLTVTPLLAVGSSLMTIDPLSVLFWTAAMIAGWRAVQDTSTTRDWLWVGVWMGLGFLSKYTNLLQLLCWVVVFALWPPARQQLRRPGPYLALALNLVFMLPVLIWNAQHDWITVSHVADDAAIGKPWQPTLRHFFDFTFSEAMLLNPVFFIATVWAALAFWRHTPMDGRLVYFFSMGAPLFLCYLLYTFHSRVLPNWIAPSVLPLFCLTAVYWERRCQAVVRPAKTWLAVGLLFGAFVVVLLHDTNLIAKLFGRHLPPEVDPLRRVRGWKQTARLVEDARAKLLAEGKPVFVIGNHYGITSQVTFYWPEAQAGVPHHRLVFYRGTAKPENQFYFWPGYDGRKGENAIFVRKAEDRKLSKFWPVKWLLGERELYQSGPLQPSPPPADLMQQFESVTDLGLHEVQYRNRVVRRVQLFACRGLR